jgi:lipopolysaccharide transport system ATP-binding protein
MIQISNLTKEYIGFHSVGDRLLTALSFGFRGGKKRFKALDQIHLEVNSSEIVGIIGRNGAGKSSLLKTIAGVSFYETGSILIKGNIRSILELGVGFNPELSGQENLYYNGLVLGYTPSEMSNLENKIFEFAGLNDFKEVPLKTYSTGMIMRLAFALATASRPENLLVDEALSVGDASFQNKCLERFKEFKKNGSSILLVSHDLNLLQTICDRIIVLDKGKLVEVNEPSKAIQKYIQILAENSSNTNQNLYNETFEFLKIELTENGVNKKIFGTGEKVVLEFEFQLLKPIPDLTIGFHITNSNGVRAFGTNTFHHNLELKDLKINKKYKIKFKFPLNLNAGKYTLGFALHKGENHTVFSYLWKDDFLDFEIEKLAVPKFDGIAYLETEIDLD